ncbi:MAG TPA: helix-turn-helix domain-containing protein [Actinocrinis sp.]|nr:helix-turn-helix domain-containing protein [Actinocrinis sp.]
MPIATLTRTEPEPQFLRVNEAKQVLRLGHTKIYELIKSGRLRSVTEGRTRLIPASAISDYSTLLNKEAEGKR